MRAPHCQRWRERRGTYRPAGEPMDPARYGVEVIPDDATARDFVVMHHYAASMPAARLRVGLYRSRSRWFTPELVGVAVFSVPMSQAVIPAWTGLGPAHGVELGRLVLLDDVPANGESWFVARAFRAVEAELPDVQAVVSFADPLARAASGGQTITPGHVGTVYQALNARHTGRTRARWLTLGPDGRVVSERALSKLRRGEQGEAYVYQQLLLQGAPRRRPMESGADYVARALREGPFERVKHPGNLGYLWALGDRRQQRRVQQGFGAPLPYPKARNVVVGAAA